MRNLSDEQKIIVQKLATDHYGYVDTWLLDKLIEYISRYGKNENALEDDFETAYIILEEKSFHEEDFIND